MKTLTLQIPNALDEQEAKRILAAKLYENDSLTLGECAELAEVSKRTFMELLGNYSVSVFNYSESELEQDIINAQNYHL